MNVITNDLADAAEVVGALIDHPAVRHINGLSGACPFRRT